MILKAVFRLIKMAGKYKTQLIVAVCATIGVAVVNLAAPWQLRKLIGIISGGQAAEQTSAILVIALWLTAFYLLRAVMLYLKNYLGHVAAWSLTGEIRVKLFQHLEKLSMRFYSDKQTGQLMSRVINDTADFETLIAHAIPDLLTNILMIIGVTGVLFTINPTLTLLTFIPVPFLVVGGLLFVKRIMPKFRAGRAALGDLNAYLQDTISGMREIQAFNQQQREEQTVHRLSFNHVRQILAALRLSAVFHPTIDFFTSMGTVIVVVFSAFMAARSAMPVEDIVGFLLYLSLFYQPIATFARLLEDTQQAQSGAERVFAVLDTPADIADAPDAILLPPASGAFTFRDVSFRYNDGQDILKNINIDVKAGEMLAIVGPTGVGKTTFTNLLSRFYDPNAGQILLDGHDISHVTLSSLRDQISMVMQDVFLFNGTVSENIAYGKLGATQEEIEHAARIACADTFIADMPDGYDTFIGERGVKLSGGQKQRLSIARAVLRNTPILILDEATANVDTETEAHIQHALNALMGTRTIIVVAHRLSTVKRADKILVLHDGTIEEQGTHQELYEKGGLYAHLCDMQFGGVE